MKRGPLAFVVFLLLLVVGLLRGPGAAPVTPAAAQQSWSWPDTAKNLKVLPKDTDKQKLRSIMSGFSGALGVRCQFCHVGKEGEPLSAFDFPSDKNPKKDVARGMMKMVGSVNDQVKQILPDVPDRVTVGCITCHHGTSRPRTLGDELTLTYDKLGADSTVARYQALRARYENSGAYDFREQALNAAGYHALEKQDPKGAIVLFRLNADRFPDSGMVHDGLGEAYRALGDTTNAVVEYQKAMKLEPRNPNPAKRLDEMHHH